MAYWILKVAEQKLYPDQSGSKYVYDNTHSVRVAKGDVFLYLDKTRGYSFTATGTIKKVTEREPSTAELARTPRVRVVFTAHLVDVVWFTKPLSISPSSVQGRKNRAQLGITDVNLLGWSQSISLLSAPLYTTIMELVDLQGLISASAQTDYSIPDTWGKTKIRPAMGNFSFLVIDRSNGTCVVCGSALAGLVEAAHLSPYATDIKNRANPANGVCLCKYCHKALDLRLIAITPEGHVLVAPDIDDPVARFHFQRVNPEVRKQLLTGVDPRFLNLTVRWHKEYLARS